MAGGHDEAMHSLLNARAGSGLNEDLLGPFCASKLVVLAANIIDCVVKPKCELDFARLDSQIYRFGEVCDALLQVLQRVVASMRLVVSRDKRAE